MTFELDDETFALDVAQVREVLDMSPITKVPRAPEFMRGVTNVRGSVVPVIDLRTKFGMPKAESTVNTRIIIMEIVLGSKTSILGAIADSVNDVLELEPSQIEDPPDLGDRRTRAAVRNPDPARSSDPDVHGRASSPVRSSL